MIDFFYHIPKKVLSQIEIPFGFVGKIGFMKRRSIWIISAALFFLGACVPAEVTPSPAQTLSRVFTPTRSPTIVATEPVEIKYWLPDDIPSGIEIEFWHPWSGEMANLIEELVSEYNRTNEWEITVRTSSHADERVLVQDVLEIGQEQPLPDILAAPPYFLQYLYEEGFALADLNEYLASEIWGFADEESLQFLPVFWNTDVRDHKRIGVPAYRSANLLFYNQTWAQSMGFQEPPADTEAFRELTCAASDGGIGGWVYEYDGLTFLSWLKAFSGGFPLEGGTPNNFLIDENVIASEYLYDLYVDDCAWIGKQPLPYQYFSNRQAILYSGQMEDILIQEEVNAINGSADQWTLIPYPAGDERPVVLVEGLSYAIFNETDQNSLAAWDFIRWILRVENQVRVVETSATYPLSTEAIALLSDFRGTHPAWADTLQYLPLVQTPTADVSWMGVQDILSDVSWRLTQYIGKDNIPFLFESADNLFAEIER